MSRKIKGKQPQKKTNRKLRIIVICAAALLAGAAVVLVVLLNQKNQYVPVNDAKSFSDWNDRIVYKGKKYRRNRDISPVLFLGVDYADGLDDAIYLGRGGRTDTIYVFLMNKKDKTTTLLSVSRDTMTEVDVYNPEGEYYYSGDMQLTMQYAYGKDAKNSCELTENTVSELLYDLDFDGYISVNLEAIRDVVDMLGGLTITMPEDYSYIDPRYTKGATVTLNSEDAEWLLRYRDETQLESNDDRMSRQTLLLQAAAEELKQTDILSLLPDILKIEQEHITTDVGLGTIKNLASFQVSDSRYSVPGTTKAGDQHAEFYVDENDLMDLLVELFYVPE